MISRAVRKIDEMPDFVPLIINMAIAAFVGLAHGGALVVALVKDPANLDDLLPLVSVTLPSAAFIALSSIIALIWSRTRGVLLTVHTLLLCAGAAAIFLWAASLLVHGIPEGNFAWSPGLMSLMCAYPVFLLRRTLLSRMIDRSFVVRYMHVMAFVVALAVDIGVFHLAISEMSSRQDMWEQELRQKVEKRQVNTRAGQKK